MSEDYKYDVAMYVFLTLDSCQQLYTKGYCYLLFQWSSFTLSYCSLATSVVIVMYVVIFWLIDQTTTLTYIILKLQSMQDNSVT